MLRGGWAASPVKFEQAESAGKRGRHGCRATGDGGVGFFQRRGNRRPAPRLQSRRMKLPLQILLRNFHSAATPQTEP